MSIEKANIIDSCIIKVALKCLNPVPVAWSYLLEICALASWIALYSLEGYPPA